MNICEFSKLFPESVKRYFDLREGTTASPRETTLTDMFIDGVWLAAKSSNVNFHLDFPDEAQTGSDLDLVVFGYDKVTVKGFVSASFRIQAKRTYKYAKGYSYKMLDHIVDKKLQHEILEESSDSQGFLPLYLFFNQTMSCGGNVQGANFCFAKDITVHKGMTVKEKDVNNFQKDFFPLSQIFCACVHRVRQSPQSPKSAISSFVENLEVFAGEKDVDLNSTRHSPIAKSHISPIDRIKDLAQRNRPTVFLEI